MRQTRCWKRARTQKRRDVYLAVDLLRASCYGSQRMMANRQFCFWREVLEDLGMVLNGY